MARAGVQERVGVGVGVAGLINISRSGGFAVD